MKKTNVNICSNCGSENPLFNKNCSVCKHYIRESVVNIDLWHTIYHLFEDPRKALKNIIYADHKNFLIFILFFFSTKLFLFSTSVQSAFELNIPQTNYFIYNILLLITIYAAIILIFSKLLTIALNKEGKTKYRDNLSLIVYSSIPVIIALFILTPVEYGIFGNHWFVYNPSPFMIKNTLAYILVGLELIMIMWSITIYYKAIHIQCDSKLFSILIVLLFLCTLITGIIFIPFTLL